MSLVTDNQIFGLCGYGTFQDPIVGVVCHDVREVQGWQEAVDDRTPFQKRVSDLRIRPSEIVTQGPLQLAFDGRRVIQLNQPGSGHA
jgi:hypothetical protein